MFPEEHGVANTKTAFHVPGAGDWPAIQDWHPFSRQCHYGLLQEASEAYLIGIFKDSNLCAIHAK